MLISMKPSIKSRGPGTPLAIMNVEEKWKENGRKIEPKRNPSLFSGPESKTHSSRQACQAGECACFIFSAIFV